MAAAPRRRGGRDECRPTAGVLPAHIDYPAAGPHSPGETGLLIYVKPSLDGDEATDLLAHWSAHAEFPHDPTTNQFFDENKVESYRQLGEHIGERVCQDLLASK